MSIPYMALLSTMLTVADVSIQYARRCESSEVSTMHFYSYISNLPSGWLEGRARAQELHGHCGPCGLTRDPLGSQGPGSRWALALGSWHRVQTEIVRVYTEKFTRATLNMSCTPHDIDPMQVL